MCALYLWLLSAQWGHPQTCPPPLLPHSAAACWTPTPDSLPAGSLTTPRPTVFLAFLFPCFFGGDKRLPALERSTPASVSSRLPGPLIPPGMFPASKQREVHLAGPADGAHAARAQVPPASPGARVGRWLRGWWAWRIHLPVSQEGAPMGAVGPASGGWAPAPSGRGPWGLASGRVGALG